MKRRGHEARAPIARAVHHLIVIVLHDDKCWQIFIFAAQTIGDPRPQRRPAAKNAAGVHLADAARVIDSFGPAGANHRDIVDPLGGMGEPIRDPQSALAMLLPLALIGQERRERFSHRRDDVGDTVGQFAASELAQLRLGSNRSRWLGPPSMKRKMTFFARGAKCDVRAASGERASADSAAASRASRLPRASAPKPAPARSKKSRRVAYPGRGSIDI